MFPIRAKLSEHRHKYLYALVLLLGFLLPAVPIVAAFTVAGGYQVSRFPPLFCVARDPPLIYYSLVMPMNVLIAIGVTMLTLIFWVVRRVSNIELVFHTGKYWKRQRHGNKAKLSCIVVLYV